MRGSATADSWLEAPSLVQTGGVHNPAVSAIIIFLDEERFLAEAIESVHAQTFTDWELILVDDGSSDGSTDIAQARAAADPDRVRYVTHPDGENRGMSASRNRGVECSTGRMVAFLDADDVWLPHKLSRQIDDLTAHPEAVMTFGPLLRWLRWAGEADAADHEDLMGVGRKKRGRHSLANRVVAPPDLVPLMLRDDYFIPGGVLVERDVLTATGGFVDVFAGMYEDAVAMMKICLANPVYISDDVSYLYRMHPDSCTQVNSSQDDINAARQRYLEWAKRHLAENGIDDREVRSALNRAQRPLRHPRLHGALDVRRRRRFITNAARRLGRVLLPRGLRYRLRDAWRRRTRPPQIDV